MRCIAGVHSIVGALERVVDLLGDREELVAAVHDLPLGVDADAAQQRHVGGEQLGDAAAVRGGVDVEDPGAPQRLGERADALDRPRRRRRPRSRRGPSRGAGRVRASDAPGCDADGDQRSIYRLMPVAHSCVPTSSAARSTAPTRPRRDGRGACARPGSTTCVELPLADGGEGTLDALLAARGGSRRTARGHRVRSATRSTPSGRCCPDGTAVVEMARASGLALVDGRNDPLRAIDARHRRADRRGAARAARARVVVGVGGSATTDGGLAAVEALGWSLARRRRDGRVRRRPRRSSTRRAVYGPQKGATDAQVALLTRRLERLAEQYRAAHRCRRHASSRARGAAGGLAGGLAAIGARARARLRRGRGGGRARGRARRRRPRRHRRGQARRDELRRARSSAACSSGPPTSGVAAPRA